MSGAGPQPCGGLGARGRVMVNRVPPLSLHTLMSPWWASTRLRGDREAKPVPSRSLRDGSPRNATSKTRGRSTSGMPPPESATYTYARSVAPRMSMTTVPSCWSVTDGVFEDVSQHAEEFRCGRDDLEARCVVMALELDTLGTSDRTRHRRAHRTRGRSGRSVELEGDDARLRTTQLEEIVDELRKTSHFLAKCSEVLLRRLFVDDDAVLKCLRDGSNAGKRRSQVMGDPGDELPTRIDRVPAPARERLAGASRSRRALPANRASSRGVSAGVRDVDALSPTWRAMATSDASLDRPGDRARELRRLPPLRLTPARRRAPQHRHWTRAFDVQRRAR